MLKKVSIIALAIVLATIAALPIFATKKQSFTFNGKTATAELQNSGTNAGAATYTSENHCSLTVSITGTYIVMENGVPAAKTCGNANGCFGNTAAITIYPFNAPVGTTFIVANSVHNANDGVGSGGVALSETYP